MPDLAAAWTALDAAAERDGRRRIVDLFSDEPDRLDRLCLLAAGLRLDLSKQPWSAAGVEAALGLAEAADVEHARRRLFAGEVVNASEGRAALHPALRAPVGAAFRVQGDPVSSAVEAGRAAVRAFTEAVRDGEVRGAGGAPFDTVVHIGIGGSELGPRMVWAALKPLAPRIDLRFVANVDGSDIAAALTGLDPARTLVVVVSKTFTTQETMANARAARAWLREVLGEGADAHLVAVSAAPAEAAAFGVSADRVFGFRDWVGGRYSIWSAVGLSCVIGLGWDCFERFLAGGAEMDAHFVSAPLDRNGPVMLALAQIYNRNGLGRPARAVIPYAERLRYLPAYLQQLEMESNGKRVRANGGPLTRATAPVVFGEPGTNGQHAFFQMLHQGTDIVPVEFIAVAHNDEGPPELNPMLLANCIAQAEALMVGRGEAEVRAELEAKGVAGAEADALAPQRAFPGDRPSTVILLDRLTPERLGALIALYEHKTFVEGVIWGINSFDQWGVELGKVLAGQVLSELTGGAAAPHDPSTAALIRQLKG